MLRQWRDLLRKFLVKHKGLFRAQKFARACAYSTPWMPYIRNKCKNGSVYAILEVLSIPVGLVNYFISPAKNNLPPNGLAVVGIVKNEGKFIEEWIEYYLLSGVDKIILFDNESTDQTADIINEYGGGTVDYHYIPGSIRQLDAYNIALRMYGKQYRYMAFLDCDEFMYGGKSLYDTIDELFQKHTDMGGLGVNWLHFGSAGHETHPDSSVIENYQWRAEEDFYYNYVIKTVAVSTRVLAFASPHYPIYRRGYAGYDELGRKTIATRTKTVSTQYIRINHYFTKSKEDWVEKVKKGRADIPKPREMSRFEQYDRNEVFDDRLCKAVEALRRQKQNKGK